MVVGGSGRIKLDDDVVELRQFDVVRVAPHVVRGFEAGPKGLEMIAVGGQQARGRRRRPRPRPLAGSVAARAFPTSQRRRPRGEPLRCNGSIGCGLPVAGHASSWPPAPPGCSAARLADPAQVAAGNGADDHPQVRGSPRRSVLGDLDVKVRQAVVPLLPVHPDHDPVEGADRGISLPPPAVGGGVDAGHLGKRLGHQRPLWSRRAARIPRPTLSPRRRRRADSTGPKIGTAPVPRTGRVDPLSVGG